MIALILYVSLIFYDISESHLTNCRPSVNVIQNTDTSGGILTGTTTYEECYKACGRDMTCVGFTFACRLKAKNCYLLKFTIKKRAADGIALIMMDRKRCLQGYPIVLPYVCKPATTIKPTVKTTAKTTKKPTIKTTAKTTKKPTIKTTAKTTKKATIKTTAKTTKKPTIKTTAKTTKKPTLKTTVKITTKAIKPVTLTTSKLTTTTPNPLNSSFTCVPKFTKTANKSMSGGTKKVMNLTTNCPGECIKTPNCIGYDFSIRFSPPVCTIFTAKGLLVANEGIDQYEIDRNQCSTVAEIETTCMQNFSVVLYKEMVGGQLVPDQEYKKCLDLCYANSSCIGFNFDLQAQLNFEAANCYLLTKLNKLKANVEYFNYMLVKNLACTGLSSSVTRCLSKYTISPNKRNFKAILIGELSILECASACLIDPNCRAFDFDTNVIPSQCFLVNGTLTSFSYSGVNSYTLDKTPCVVATTTTTTTTKACTIDNCAKCDALAEKCLLCNPYFGFDSNSNCVSCSRYCFFCAYDANVCTNCIPGFTLTDSVCTPPKIVICTECADCTDTGCAKCKSGFALNPNDNTNCNKCSVANCVNCDENLDLCSQCDSNLNPSPNNSTCI